MDSKIRIENGLTGYKLLQQNCLSLNGEFQYRPGEWQEVPGNGSYVAVSGGLFSAGNIRKNTILVGVRGEERVLPTQILPEGVECYRKVQIILLDQALLARIAVEDSDWNVRRAAVERVSDQDQALLARIAVED